MRRILVMQLARLGDVVQTWPLLRRLRQGYPDAHLSLLLDQAWRDLARFGPPLDELHALAMQETASLASRHVGEAYQALQGILGGLRRQNFDLVFNLNFSRLSLLIVHLLKAPARGYRPAAGGREFRREPWLAYIYALVHARVFNRIHLSDVFRHLAPPADMVPLHPRPSRPWRLPPLIALQLATRHPKRTWPLPSFARLAALLINRLEARLVLLGSAAERPLGERLAASLPPPLRERLDNLQGRTDLAELTTRLQEADLLISGDTGTLHLAAALGTRVAAIFLGPALCFETGPYGAGQVIIQAEPECHPCPEAGPACAEPVCRQMIAPELVAQAVGAWREGQDLGERLRPPAGVRVYGSIMDRFGADYAVVAGQPPGWVELVGRTYRAAGARLLGYPPPPLRFPEIAGADLGILRQLSKALQNGADAPREAAVMRALTPLRAWEAFWRQQGRSQAGNPANTEQFQGLQAVLGEELQRGLNRILL